MMDKITTDTKDPMRILKLLKIKRQEELDLIEKEKIIILKRKQVSTNNPAIAQLWIKIPKSLDFKEDLLSYYEERKIKYSISAPIHKIEKRDDKFYVLEIKGVLPMYKWMEYFIKSFKRDFSKKYKVESTGCWEKYENES